MVEHSFQELTDGDILNEGEDGAAELIESLANGRIVEAFVTAFEKLNESEKDDADAIHNALSIVENVGTSIFNVFYNSLDKPTV